MWAGSGVAVQPPPGRRWLVVNVVQGEMAVQLLNGRRRLVVDVGGERDSCSAASRQSMGGGEYRQESGGLFNR